jgi:hypothetical protein
MKTTRRDFLRTAALAFAGTALLSKAAVLLQLPDNEPLQPFNFIVFVMTCGRTPWFTYQTCQYGIYPC